jgi:hypothetical protein
MGWAAVYSHDMRRVMAAIAATVMWSATIIAQPTTTSPVAAQASGGARATKVSTEFTCPADLGVGVKTRRRFCDVIIGRTPADGVVVGVPAHTGAATLLFDLHNRFLTMPEVDAIGRLPQVALVAVVNSAGGEIDRAAVMGQMRNATDVFDQLPGTGPGGVKLVAPGRVESIRITIPAGISSVSIVGVSLTVEQATGHEIFDAPGRPVAIVSNVRIQYAPIR